MNIHTNPSDTFKPRQSMRLSVVEDLIRKNKIITPVPSRPTLIEMCEDGTFETVKDTRTIKRFGYLVFVDSFWEWAKILSA